MEQQNTLIRTRATLIIMKDLDMDLLPEQGQKNVKELILRLKKEILAFLLQRQFK